MSAVLITGMSGAGKSTIPVDARQPLDQVVDAILSRTPGRAAAGQAGLPGNQPAR
jgi:thymidylate kinase